MDKGIRRLAEVARGIVDLLLGADTVVAADYVQKNRNSPFATQ
jgi:hypothetical protein